MKFNPLEKYINERHPETDFFQLTAEEKNRIAESLSFSSWKTVQAAKEIKELVDHWAKNSKI